MKINYFCYPYGGKESFNDNTLKILNKMGFNYCFGLDYLPINKKVNFITFLEWIVINFLMGRQINNEAK